MLCDTCRAISLAAIDVSLQYMSIRSNILKKRCVHSTAVHLSSFLSPYDWLMPATHDQVGLSVLPAQAA